MSEPFSLTLPDTTLVTIPAAAGLAADDALPWLIDIDVYEQAVAQTNWDTINPESSAIFRFLKQNSGAQNDAIAWDVVLAKGTWTVELLYMTDPAAGIYTVQFDGVSKGTIDAYAAVRAYNVLGSVASIAVTTSAKVRLNLITASKNASSSGYNAWLQHVQLRRTA